MEKLLQTLMDGLAVGSLYALIALGYTMVYGILKFINFAHSDVFTLGAWLSCSAALAAGWPEGDPIPAAPWVMVALGGVCVVGGGLWAWEKLGRRASGRGTTFLLVGAWGWATLGLLFLARMLRTNDAELLAGGLILVVAMSTCGLVGFCLERLAYKPLRRAPRLNVLITAIGVSLFLQNIGQLDWMFGTRPQPVPALLNDRVLNETVAARGQLAGGQTPGVVRFTEAIELEADRQYRLDVQTPDGRESVLLVPASGRYEPGDPIEIAGSLAEAPAGSAYALVRAPSIPIRLINVIGAGTAVALMLLLDWLVFHTRLGRAMRAVAFSPANASLMGIPVDRVISITFVTGAMLAAAAGFLYGQKYESLGQPAAAVWVLLGLKAFVAAVVGGIGNIRGAMLGGILIGLLEFFGVAYFSPQLRDLYVFALLIAVLLFRPGGIMGKAVTEKV